MQWVEKLRAWLVGPDLDAVAESIAADCRCAVWQRIHQRALGLTLAEARGYVRIRAGHVVKSAVADRLRADRTLQGRRVEEVHRRTMDAILRQATLDLISAQRAIQPPHTHELRRAA